MPARAIQTAFHAPMMPLARGAARPLLVLQAPLIAVAVRRLIQALARVSTCPIRSEKYESQRKGV